MDDDMTEPEHPAPHCNPVHSPNSVPVHPAKDMRMTSPTLKRRTNGPDVERTNGVGHKPKTKGRQDSSNPLKPAPAIESKETPLESLPRKPNEVSTSGGPGGNDLSHHNPGGGWQTTKKKSKKGAKTSVEPTQLNINGVEPLPADESLRKGG